MIIARSQGYKAMNSCNLKQNAVPFTIAPKNEIPRYKYNKICSETIRQKLYNYNERIQRRFK